MIEPMILESVISNYLTTAARDWLVERNSRNFDFLVEPAADKLIAIEVFARVPSPQKLQIVKRYLSAHATSISELLLVTPERPSSAELDRANGVLAELPVPFRWVGVNDLPDALGLPRLDDDLLSARSMARLQTEALLKNVVAYRLAPIGPGGTERVSDYLQSLGGGDAAASPSISANEIALSRQLSFGTLSVLGSQAGTLESKLRFGERIDNATIVLSDLKSFSSLVCASRPDDLNEMMARYYQRARNAVFKHGGMLDKFIGDAVLAVFGYPSPTPQAPTNSLRFALELIDIGADILGAWQSELNALIETGTRVGIATGDIWPMNIGQREVEISLLGDTINLAARLEKNCSVNGVLMDNRTRTKARAVDATFVDSLSLTEDQLQPSDAKGQQHPLRVWRYSPRLAPIGSVVPAMTPTAG
jgi:class 3 adenylate cyclase